MRRPAGLHGLGRQIGQVETDGKDDQPQDHLAGKGRELSHQIGQQHEAKEAGGLNGSKEHDGHQNQVAHDF